MSSWTGADAVLIVAILAQSAVLGANLFEYVVIVPNWREPGGVVAYRTLMRRRHPGHYFQSIVPVTVVVLVAALITNWSETDAAALIGASLAAIVVAEAFTLLYFFPRNRALFLAPTEAEPGAQSDRLVRQWAAAAPIRIAIVAVGVLASLFALSLH